MSGVSNSVWPHRRQPTRPPSLEFSRQEYWSGLPCPSPGHESEKWKWSHSVVSDGSLPHGLQPTRLLHPWDFPNVSPNQCYMDYLFETLPQFHGQGNWGLMALCGVPETTQGASKRQSKVWRQTTWLCSIASCVREGPKRVVFLWSREYIGRRVLGLRTPQKCEFLTSENDVRGDTSWFHHLVLIGTAGPGMH